jgi:hypothetical protein
MTEQDRIEMESSQRQANEEKLTYEKLCANYESRVLNTFKLTGASLKKDGDEWHVLLGDDIATGVSGFGDDPYSAMVKFFEELGLA